MRFITHYDLELLKNLEFSVLIPLDSNSEFYENNNKELIIDNIDC